MWELDLVVIQRAGRLLIAHSETHSLLQERYRKKKKTSFFQISTMELFFFWPLMKCILHLQKMRVDSTDEDNGNDIIWLYKP